MQSVQTRFRPTIAAGRKSMTVRAAVVSAVVLLLGAQTAFAHPPARNPSINLTDLKIVWADEQTAEGYAVIANTTGDGAVTIETGFMAWEWIGQGGVRAECPTVSWVTDLPIGTEIFVDTSITVNYSIECLDPPPFDPREIKNYGCVTLEGRDKLFCSSGSYKLGGN